MDEELNVYIGIGLSFVFSLFFLFLLIRAALSQKEINWRIIAVVVSAMIISVTFVGNAPYISLLQGVIISLGCLRALYRYIVTEPNPNSKIVGTLVVAMLACLLINQASRSFNIGLVNWFKVEVQGSDENASKQLDSLIARIRHLENKVSISAFQSIRNPDSVQTPSNKSGNLHAISESSSRQSLTKKTDENDKSMIKENEKNLPSEPDNFSTNKRKFRVIGFGEDSLKMNARAKLIDKNYDIFYTYRPGDPFEDPEAFLTVIDARTGTSQVGKIALGNSWHPSINGSEIMINIIELKDGSVGIRVLPIPEAKSNSANPDSTSEKN